MNHVLLRGALIAALLVLAACSRPAADFTLTLGGDIMLSREGDLIFEIENEEINPWKELQKQGVLEEPNIGLPDYFFANLESPLGENPSETTNMNLCSHPAQVRVLIEGGVDLVSLANNHRDDCVMDGADITKSFLEQQNTQSAIQGVDPAFIDVPGGRMAVVAAEDVTSPLDVELLLKEIKNTRKQAQVVVVSMHWGNEYQAGADQRQQTLAKQIADAGADVIWGHHPHVLQKMKWLESADGRQVLVLYSLGNLLADQWMLEDAQHSALVRLSFKNSQIAGIEIFPLLMDRESRSLQLAESSDLRNRIVERLGVDDLISENARIQVFSKVDN